MNVNNSMLILSVSPESISRPYYFDSTHRKIYSLEELMYHCYYYWKQSIDDFLAGKIEIWIKEELKLPYLASRIEKIKDREHTITAQYSAFLDVIDYFEIDEINSITKEVYSWENMDQWQKLKEKGDIALENEQYTQAVKYYLESIDINDNVTILNNLGVAYMKQEKFEDALMCLQKAHFKEPYNEDIVVNTAQVLMLQGDYETAKAQLKKFDFASKGWKAYKLYGEISYIQQDYENALIYFKKAIDLGDDFTSNIRIADIYSVLGEYKGAINAIEAIRDKDNDQYYYNYARINYKFGKVRDAIIQAEKAVEINKRNLDAWILLVKLYKKVKDIPQAEKALLKVFELDPDNDEAKLEYATLKKSKGLIKDYQEILKGMLNKWKQRYREQNN